jgi:hypothetical protein
MPAVQLHWGIGMGARDDFFSWLDDTQALCRDLGVSAVDPERFFAEIVSRVRAMLAEDDEKLLTLAEAARRTGYSEDHIGRLVRIGKLPNAGAPNRPRVRAADLAGLPRRNSRSFATTSHIAYDPAADARALLGRRGGRRA